MPGVVGDTCLIVDGPGQHKEQIAEPVEIFNGIGRRGGLEPGRKGYHPPLRPAADRPGHVQ